MTDIIPDNHRAFIEAKKRIEWRYAKEHMEPPERQFAEDEPEFRERVREAITELSTMQKRKMREDKQHEYQQMKKEIRETTPEDGD